MVTAQAFFETKLCIRSCQHIAKFIKQTILKNFTYYRAYSNGSKIIASHCFITTVYNFGYWYNITVLKTGRDMLTLEYNIITMAASIVESLKQRSVCLSVCLSYLFSNFNAVIRTQEKLLKSRDQNFDLCFIVDANYFGLGWSRGQILVLV